MHLTLIQQPATLPVPLSDMQEWLRAEGPDYASLVTASQRAAVSQLDGKNGSLGRALVTQRWRLTLDGQFPGPVLRLPLPPLQSVETLSWRDLSGAWQTLDPDTYRVLTDREPGEVHAGAAGWPVTDGGAGSVLVDYTAGHNPESVPEEFRTLVKWLTAREFDHPTPGSAPAIGNTEILQLIRKLRIWGFR